MLINFITTKGDVIGLDVENDLTISQLKIALIKHEHADRLNEAEIKILCTKFKCDLEGRPLDDGHTLENYPPSSTLTINLINYEEALDDLANLNVRGEVDRREIRTKTIENFDISSSKSTGGVTGSVRVCDRNDPSIFYQLKPSILDNTLFRRLKAKSTDRENFGEVIASSVGRSIFNAIETECQIPVVELVYDNQKRRVLIASKYIQGNLPEIPSKTLDEYIKERDKGLVRKSHASFVAGDSSEEGNIGFNVHYMLPLKASLIDAIAISAVLGDHDINPGNMLVVVNHNPNELTHQKPSLARIDLGHAFNDLLNAPVILGGKLQNPEHPILDFINREKIAGLNGGAPSKLWRDYPGICSNKEISEIAKSFRKIGEIDENIIREGVENAKKAFWNLILDMKENKDWDGIAHIHATLVEIHNNISSESMTLEDDPEKIEQQINRVFDQCTKFVIKNCRDALHTSNLMVVQSTTQNLLREISSDLVHTAVLKLPEARALQAENEGDGKFTWVKRREGTLPFVGSIEQLLIFSNIQILSAKSSDPLIMLAREILNFIEFYKADVGDQLVGSTIGIQKSQNLEDGLYVVVEALGNRDIRSAIFAIRNLKENLINNFGENNFIGKSIAIQSVIQIEQDLVKQQQIQLRKGNMGFFRQSIESTPSFSGQQIQKEESKAVPKEEPKAEPNFHSLIFK